MISTDKEQRPKKRFMNVVSKDMQIVDMREEYAEVKEGWRMLVQFGDS